MKKDEELHSFVVLSARLIVSAFSVVRAWTATILLCKAISAVDRGSFTRFERDFSFVTAFTARYFVHCARTEVITAKSAASAKASASAASSSETASAASATAETISVDHYTIYASFHTLNILPDALTN